jgi:branched-chain amino acid transport system permease protein
MIEQAALSAGRPRLIGRPLGWAVAGAVAVGILALIPSQLSDQWQIALINIYFGVYLCIAWNIIAGFAGQFALGQPVFLAIGAYTSSLLFLRSGVSPWAGMVSGAVLAGAVALLFGYLAFRYRVRGLYFALLTFASLVVAGNLVANVNFLGGAAGLILPLRDDTASFVWRDRLPYYYVMLGLTLLAVLVSVAVARSALGWRLEAVQQDEDAASAIGIDISRVKIYAFIVSAMLTALAGTFYAQFYELVSPDTVLTFDPQITMLLGTIIGGIGTLAGPIVGGLLVGAFTQLIQALPLDSRVTAILGQATFAVFLIVISVYAPAGLVGLARGDGLIRRFARRARSRRPATRQEL